MPVPSTARRMPAVACNGVQDTFPFDFLVFSDTDVRVVLLNTDTSVETEWTLGVEFTVSINPDQGSDPGGNVVAAVAPANNFTLTIVGGMAYDQTTALPDGGAYRAEDVQTALDRLAIQIQQVKEAVDRCAQVPVSGGDADALNTAINLLSANLATLQIIVDNIGALVALGPISGDITTVAGVAGSIPAVAAVADDFPSAVIVATNIADVNAVAANIADVVAVADEIPNLAVKVSKDSDTGAAFLPSGTTAQRPVAPLDGYTRYNTTLQTLEVYDAVNTLWKAAGQGASGAVNNPVFYENDQLVTGDYAIPADKNAMSAGPITVDTGVTVTISSGATWSIV